MRALRQWEIQILVSSMHSNRRNTVVTATDFGGGDGYSMGESLEPQINSPDPEERKLARRLRIERRCDALRKAKQSIATVSGGSVLDEQGSPPILEQLQKSAELLQQYLYDGEEYITNVRVANDSREVDRRENEGINREKIMNQLDDEAQEAERIFMEIANKWGVIEDYNDPLHIHEDIMNQKDKCDMLIKQKDGIIAMLTEELKNSEKQFTKDQHKQIEDINVLSGRIEKQITFMRRAYRHELEIIEEVILQERQNLIDSTDKRWEELYKKRENLEISNSEKKFEQLQDFEQRMTKLRMDFQEHYRETKIKLENDIDELQRELERIKALALLNSEKLDYNYQILKKREDENIIIKSQQKRRMNKLQDIITDLHNQIIEYETSTSNKIKKLTGNVKKLHNSILEVEAKADHFAHVNDEKFHKVWELNKKEVQGVLTKILQTDRILYEQHMGLDWEAPSNYVIDKRSLPSYKVALNIVDPKFIHETDPDSEGVGVKMKVSQINCKQSKSSVNNVNSDQDERETRIYRGILKHILTRISDKSGFLAEKRLKSLLKGYEDDQKNLVRLDHVFAALGIQDSAYITVLIRHFMPYTFCALCQGSRPSSALQVESRTKSDTSHLSSMFAKFADTDTIKIPELEELIVAIRQPETLMDAIVAEMVTAEEFFEESSSDLLQAEDVNEICGSPDTDQYSLDKSSKEKIRIIGHSKSRAAAAAFSGDIYFCQVNHHLVMSSVYVLKALREFVASYYVGKSGMPTVGERLERKRITISRYLSKPDIKLYWEKFRLNFNEDKVRVWEALLAGLKKYHEILKDRKLMCDEVLKLRKENAELKRLLANYLDHGALMEPPCATRKQNINK